jgi:hypothetical protein
MLIGDCVFFTWHILDFLVMFLVLINEIFVYDNSVFQIWFFKMYVCCLNNISPHLLTTCVTFRSIFGYHYKVLGADTIKGANGLLYQRIVKFF